MAKKIDDGGVAVMEQPRVVPRLSWRVEVKSSFARVLLQTILADTEEAAKRQWEASTGLGWGPACSISQITR